MIFHNPQKTGKTRVGGITTLVPKSSKVEAHSQRTYHLTVGLKFKEGERFSIINLYLPPASGLNSRAEQGIWEEIHDALGGTPINDLVIIVGDFIAHLGSNSAISD